MVLRLLSPYFSLGKLLPLKTSKKGQNRGSGAQTGNYSKNKKGRVYGNPRGHFKRLDFF